MLNAYSAPGKITFVYSCSPRLQSEKQKARGKGKRPIRGRVGGGKKNYGSSLVLKRGR